MKLKTRDSNNGKVVIECDKFDLSNTEAFDKAIDRVRAIYPSNKYSILSIKPDKNDPEKIIIELIVKN